MSETRERGWLQKILEDADKRVNDWPEWKKELVEERRSSDKAQASGEPSATNDSEGETQSRAAHW